MKKIQFDKKKHCPTNSNKINVPYFSKLLHNPINNNAWKLPKAHNGFWGQFDLFMVWYSFESSFCSHNVTWI